MATATEEGLGEGNAQLLWYTKRDERIVDYQPYLFEGTETWFRGPDRQRLPAGAFWACLGAADAAGIMSPKPYASLIETQIGLPVVNLGYGGASPDFYLRQEPLITAINRARFVLLEAMPARGESNSRYQSIGHLQRVVRKSDGEVIRGDQVWSELAATEPPEVVEEILEETRNSWVESHRRLIAAIDAPVVFFYFSRRSPDEWKPRTPPEVMMKVFPQFVNRRMVDAVQELCIERVECVTERGSPAPITDRVTGESITEFRASPGVVWSSNAYYPSPEMHADAAAALYPVCGRLAEARAGAGG